MNDGSTSPLVTVVIATHDRAEMLGRALGSLNRQELDPGSYEVVVVDDCSADETSAAIEASRVTGGPEIISVRTDRNLGAAGARNVGWRRARGSLVAFTDDDCEAHPMWLTTLLGAHRRDPDAVLQGRTEPDPAQANAIGPFSRTLSVKRLGPSFQTCNVAYPRRLLENLRGFDDRTFRVLGEDTDLAWRAIEAGSRPVLVPDALVHHAVRQLGPLGKLRVAARREDGAGAVRRHPGLRRHLHHRVFWKRSHELLLLAAAGTILGRRRPTALLLVVPYLLQLARRGGAGNPPLGAYWVVHDLVETGARIRDSARHRTVVL